MTFIIEPNKGIGNVDLGVPRNEVRTSLASKYESFKRNPFSKVECDYFEEYDLFVYYDNGYICEAFEFGDRGDVVFLNTHLSSLNFEGLKKLIFDLDNDIEIEDGCITSYKLGVGATQSEETDNWSSVILFISGYYD